MLREGSIIYDGPIQGVREYCAQIGSPCPASANPADHMMAAISSENPETVSDENTRKLEEMFTTVHDLVDVDRGKGRAARYMRTPVPFVIQCRMGLLRATVLLARRRTEWIIYLIVTIVNAVLVGTVFLRIGTGPSSIVKRSPALFFVVVNQATFGAISTISVLPGERAVILRERASGNLSALSYFATKAFAEMVWKLPFPIIFSIITYFLIGFQPTAHHFFRYFGTIVLSFLTGMGVAFAVSGLIRVASIASIVLPLIMELSRLFAGYFLAPSLQFPGLRWIDYLSYIHYGYNAVSQNEMGDLVIAGVPQVNTLHSKGLYMSYSESMGILGCYFVITLIIAYLGVRFITW
jgi:ATP-binding cassette subfamily G (WHITE) protein 2